MIKIYQNYYSEETKKHCKSYFDWHNNTGNDDGEYEYSVMKKVYFQPWDDITHKGVLSWKFENKINKFREFSHPNAEVFSALSFHNIIHEKSNEYDVFHMNSENFHGPINVWKQGAIWNPKIMNCLQRINDELNIGHHWRDIIFTEKTLIFCNYWVASKKFWDLWMSYAIRIYPIAKQFDDFPYIMERIAPSVLHDHQEELKILPCAPLLLK